MLFVFVKFMYRIIFIIMHFSATKSKYFFVFKCIRRKKNKQASSHSVGIV
ncbi:hypothetical protein HanIR_Chr11g0530041 [Helianthus annuus]|nr:hypothetical protein HanIR_Chr11g0530041 [Helianthus annuus]